MTDYSGGYDDDFDLMMAELPKFPFDWIREGTSLWIYDEHGRFGLPRIGVEAEPRSWDNRRYMGTYANAEGRRIQTDGMGATPPIVDENGLPSVMGAGPMTFRCLEPWKRWLVTYDGDGVDTDLDAQIAGVVDRDKTVPLKFEIEVEMAAPPNAQHVSPDYFASLKKGQQRDIVSVGLGLRWEQALTGKGWIEIDGRRETFRGLGNRVKRRSIRTDALFLRGHVWQSALFPDGSAFGIEVRPPHEDGFEPWNHGYVYIAGRMHEARASKVPWFVDNVPEGEDVSLVLESELGTHEIKGSSTLNSYRVGNVSMWGMNLGQGAAWYEWNGVRTIGMIERSRVTKLSAGMD